MRTSLLIRIATVTSVIAFQLVVGASDGTDVARATTGVGGTISLGVPLGASLPAVTTAATDAYAGFNLHARTIASSGVSLTGMSGSPTGSTIVSAGDLSSITCGSSVPTPGDFVLGCVALNGQQTTAAGLLATLTLSATGNGCANVRLVTVAVSDPLLAQLHTYTINTPLAPTDMQANTVATNLVQVLIGSGTPADCASIASVGGVAAAPDLPTAAVSAHGSRGTFDTLAIALAAAAVVAASSIILYARRARGQ